MRFLIHIRHSTGCVQTMAFATAFARSLALIGLSPYAECWFEDMEG